VAWAATVFQLLTGSVAADTDVVDKMARPTIVANQTTETHLGFCIVLSSLERRLRIVDEQFVPSPVVAAATGFPRSTMFGAALKPHL